MLAKKPETSIAQTSENSLKTLLRNESSRELVKYVGTLSARKLFAAQKEASELNVALDYLRKRHKALTAAKADKKEIAFIKKQGEELKSQLDALDVKPTILQLSTEGEDDLVADLSLLILDMHESFNIGKGLNGSQIEHLAISIIQRMGYFTLEDIALCFHRAKCGDYGQIYDRLDLNVVNGWLNHYKQERKELHKSEQQNRHLASKVGMSYDPKDSASINRVAQERGIQTEKDAHYEEFKNEFLTKNSNTNEKREK